MLAIVLCKTNKPTVQMFWYTKKLSDKQSIPSAIAETTIGIYDGNYYGVTITKRIKWHKRVSFGFIISIILSSGCLYGYTNTHMYVNQGETFCPFYRNTFCGTSLFLQNMKNRLFQRSWMQIACCCLNDKLDGKLKLRHQAWKLKHVCFLHMQKTSCVPTKAYLWELSSVVLLYTCTLKWVVVLPSSCTAVLAVYCSDQTDHHIYKALIQVFGPFSLPQTIFNITKWQSILVISSCITLAPSMVLVSVTLLNTGRFTYWYVL